MEVRVPDIGDFTDVPIIAVLVKAGDRIEKEHALVTLESEKATVDVPAPAAGTVREVKVKVGDKVAEGSLLLILDTAEKEPPPAPEEREVKEPPPAAKGQARQSGSEVKPSSSYDCDVLVLGSGPGGYSAAFRAADLGQKTILVERYPALGGVCLNVGCIPSKALLHVAAVMDEARAMGAHGVSYAEPKIDLESLRTWKNKVVGRLTGGVASMAKGRKVEVVTGSGKFVDPHTLQVGERRIRFDKAIIAAGSQAGKLPFLPQDPRIVDSTGALELDSIPRRMLVIGGGIIGMEMATVYSTLGTRVDVVEMLEGLMPGTDRDLVQAWQKKNAPRFDRVMLKTRTTAASARDDGIHVEFDGAGPAIYDLVLVSVGRTPNGKRIGAEAAGVVVDERGFVTTDKQMRTNVAHIFAIGDIAGPPMLAHKASHEGHVAAEAAAGQKSFFDARCIPSVAYTDPEIAWTGETEETLKGASREYGKAVFPWAASGRALANGREEGFTKLLYDKSNLRIIGGGIVGQNAGELIAEICLAIEMGADVEDVGHTIHPHPTLSESIGLGAELAAGFVTDLPPPRRR
ncbi:MAG: dihydrolipoyl dehydrogenase [Deltaproteobacteria bacterium]|nr:MAG: dihydrolipoyl dehydrogenase [Deltaproteobacteria bacterium]